MHEQFLAKVISNQKNIARTEQIQRIIACPCFADSNYVHLEELIQGHIEMMVDIADIKFGGYNRTVRSSQKEK